MKTSKLFLGILGLAVVMGLLAGCGGGNFTIPTSLPSKAIPQGRSDTVKIAVTPTGGLKGDITFAVSGAPTGVTAAFNPAKLTAAGDNKALETTLTLTVAPTVATGKYTITVTATSGKIKKEGKLELTVQVAPDITVTASPATLTVKQGATGQVTINIKRTETMKEAVALTVEGAPPGVTVTVEPANVAATATSATLKIEVGPAVEAKDYNLTIRGKATGIDKTATLKLTVQAVDFSLKAEPAAVTVAPGGTATVKITITRTNLTDAVSFVAKDLPAGVTAAFSPVSATGNETSLTLTAAAGATPGSYSVTVEGTAAGKTKAATISLTIQ